MNLTLFSPLCSCVYSVCVFLFPPFQISQWNFYWGQNGTGFKFSDSCLKFVKFTDYLYHIENNLIWLTKGMANSGTHWWLYIHYMHCISIKCISFLEVQPLSKCTELSGIFNLTMCYVTLIGIKHSQSIFVLMCSRFEGYVLILCPQKVLKMPSKPNKYNMLYKYSMCCRFVNQLICWQRWLNLLGPGQEKCDFNKICQSKLS